ncbi:ANKRD12, partial [Symbiodinium sp. CCMP2592]
MLRLRALSGEQLLVVDPREQAPLQSVLDTLYSIMATRLRVVETRLNFHSMDETRPLDLLDSWQDSERLLAGHYLDVLMLMRPCRAGGEDELAWAIERGHWFEVDRLLASWVDPNVDLSHRATLETEGSTALCCACSVDNVEVATSLISARADVNRRDWDMDSPLLIAASMGSRSMVRLLLRNAADASQEDAKGRGPIERCFIDSSIGPVISLLRAGATVRPYTENFHLLHQAAERGSLNWVTCLVR